MPGPPKQFDRDAALMKSMDLFWRQGFEATSIEDLVQAVGINRSSMYATFGGKEALFLQALRLYADEYLARMAELLRGRGKPLSRLRRMLRNLGKEAQEGGFRGCFVGNTAAELGVKNPEATEIMRSTMMRGMGLLVEVLEQAKAEGELGPKTQTAPLASFIATFIQGIYVTSQVTCAVAAINQQVDALMSAIRTGDWS